MKQMTNQEFLDSGLLYRVNTEFFWPLGLALGLAVKTGTREAVEGVALQVNMTDPAEVIVDYDLALEDASDKWITARLSGIIA